MTPAMKNRSDKDMIRAFAEFTTHLKRRGINPWLHIMDSKVSKAVKIDMATMDINYQ